MNRRQFLAGLLSSAAVAPIASALGDGVTLTSIAHPTASLEEIRDLLMPGLRSVRVPWDAMLPGNEHMLPRAWKEIFVTEEVEVDESSFVPGGLTLVGRRARRVGVPRTETAGPDRGIAS